MKNNKKQTVMIIILGAITLMCIFGIFYLWFGKKLIAPDYAPGVIDSNAVPLPNDGSKLSTTKGGGAVNISYATNIAINLKTKKIKLFFKNPSESNQDIVLQIILTNKDKEEIVISQTDRLPAGYAIYEMDLSNSVALAVGGYDGKFNILYYNTENGEKAILNTNIPIKIAVN